LKAAVLRSAPGELEVADVDIDRPAYREVLIKTAAAGLCHSDLHFIDGTYPAMTPMVLGHESAGVVEAVGDQVTYVKPGDHVITCLSVFCGHCEDCLSGNPARCTNPETARPKGSDPRLSENGNAMGQFLNLSSFAEQMLVHEHALVKIRDDMPLDLAALIGCGVTTGLGAVFNTAGVEPGTTVAVIGCGGVGLATIRGALIAGASRIIAVDTLESKLEMATTFGATDVVNASEEDPVGKVMELTWGGVHYAFEAIGLKVTSEQAFNMLRRGGTATIIGMIPLGQTIELPGVAFLGEKKIQGCLMGSTRFRIDMPRYIELYLQGRLNLEDMVSQRLNLDQINEGFEAMKAGEVARSVVVFD
jgi:S-(hydroxymethyl)glutathione dehydrogenase / alcohol dehydrogenase